MALKSVVQIFIAFLTVLVTTGKHSRAACTITINTFPYAEDFETGPNGWTTGGVNNDWTRGAPTKPVINAAASGTKCWITGGLTASFYQYGERSWVESPCFDFSLLDYPAVTFQIFWETENQYDGGNLQYSINGGTTWINVGVYNEPADCFTQNWFNQVSINNLNSFVNVIHGWSGTTLPSSGSCVGGNGSGGWKLAKHCLKNLAHEPQVQFRFTFGSGTQCNDYDGLAFDDFRIEESAPSIAGFTYNCNSGTDISFTDASSTCPETYSWIFGDGQTSSLSNPVHTFSQPGVYEVKLVTGNSCSASDTISQTITILQATVTSTDESCAGLGDGTATVTVNPSGAYNYSWNTTPVQTGTTASNLQSGSYTVTVSGANACTVSASVQVQLTSTNFSATTSAVQTSCAGANDGLAVLEVTNPSLYTFSWNTVPVQTTDTAFNLVAGTYVVTVNGPGLCAPQDFTADVPEGNAGTPENFLGHDTSSCTGNVIVLHAEGFATYLWDDGSDSAYRMINGPGTYFLEVTTAAGCRGRDSIFVEEKCLDDVVFPNSFTPNNDGLNDLFKAYGLGVKNFLIRIYDRWGEIVFESTSVDDVWDGTYQHHLVQDGVYVCVVDYSMDGVNARTKKGMVVLMRGIKE